MRWGGGGGGGAAGDGRRAPDQVPRRWGGGRVGGPLGRADASLMGSLGRGERAAAGTGRAGGKEGRGPRAGTRAGRPAGDGGGPVTGASGPAGCLKDLACGAEGKLATVEMLAWAPGPWGFSRFQTKLTTPVKVSNSGTHSDAVG
jgi:hypothetical protein